MSARERIRSVAFTLSEPRSTNWISEQAEAAWITTNQELDDLVDHGRLRRVDAGETTLYQPDYTRLLLDEIRILIQEHTREELQNELAAIADEIEEWRETYDVETWENLNSHWRTTACRVPRFEIAATSFGSGKRTRKTGN